MRILQITAPSPAGGLERVVLGLASALRERGHEVAVLASIGHGPDPHPFVEALHAAGVEVHPQRLARRGYREELAAILRAIDELAPEILHTHGFRSDVLGLVAARRRGLPVVSTVHGLTGGDWKVRLYERLQQLALRWFDAVVAVSRPLADRFVAAGVRPERVHMVRNALVGVREPIERTAARRALDLPENATVVGWVGRFGAEKGPDLFVDAMAHLDNSVIGAMIGDGPERAPLAERVRADGLAGRLRLPGRIDAADRYLLAFDVLALTSRTEGTPMILLEAMAAGVPIVTTAVGGVPDVVGPAEAVLVPAGSGEAIAQALESVLARADEAAAR
ncbi:MAG TPA: glycosyltransferase, partial [Gemmatimonadales bacterium]|nr:glycosyltransferase [Gemmatimonadales bacterium]